MSPAFSSFKCPERRDGQAPPCPPALSGQHGCLVLEAPAHPCSGCLFISLAALAGVSQGGSTQAPGHGCPSMSCPHLSFWDSDSGLGEDSQSPSSLEVALHKLEQRGPLPSLPPCWWVGMSPSLTARADGIGLPALGRL